MKKIAKQTVEAMIEGGKASAAPPLGPALGPTGVNIGQVITEINKKTADMKGMQVPVKVHIDPQSKTFEIEIGTPPTAALIKKEAGVEKGASNPRVEKIADLMVEQLIKIAKIKEDSLGGSTLKKKVKEIIGTCVSMGILVEGMNPKDALVAIDQGKFDAKINTGRTELTEAEKKHLEEERKRLREDTEKRMVEYMNRAKAILKEMEGKESKKIRAKMMEEQIPMKIVDELAPAQKDAKAAPGGKK